MNISRRAMLAATAGLLSASLPGCTVAKRRVKKRVVKTLPKQLQPGTPSAWCWDDQCKQFRQLTKTPLRRSGEHLPRSARRFHAHGSTPPFDPSPSQRYKNWGTGSCEFASLATLCEWQGFPEMAQYIRQNYRGGFHIADPHGGGLAGILDKYGFDFAYTVDGDTQFLDWVTATRRGAVIEYYKKHCVNFAGWDATTAYLLDNNHVDEFRTVPRDEFVHNWQRAYGGNALTLLYDPPPAIPHI